MHNNTPLKSAGLVITAALICGRGDGGQVGSRQVTLPVRNRVGCERIFFYIYRKGVPEVKFGFITAFRRNGCWFVFYFFFVHDISKKPIRNNTLYNKS